MIESKMKEKIYLCFLFASVTPRPLGPLVVLMETVDWPHKLTQVFPVHFGLTRAHLGTLSRRSPILRLLPTKHA